MEPGARIRVAWDEPWPHGTSTLGEVERWIENPGRPGDTSPIVKLDSPVTAEGTVDGKRETMTGLYLSLGLRYEGQTWDGPLRTVHVMLSSEDPKTKNVRWAWVAAYGEWMPA